MGLIFCQFEWPDIPKHIFLKEEKASSVSASCTLNCLSCEDNPYCLRAVAVHTPLSWQIREVSKKSTLHWDKGRYCDYFFCLFGVFFLFFFFSKFLSLKLVVLDVCNEFVLTQNSH